MIEGLVATITDVTYEGMSQQKARDKNTLRFDVPTVNLKQIQSLMESDLESFTLIVIRTPVDNLGGA